MWEKHFSTYAFSSPHTEHVSVCSDKPESTWAVKIGPTADVPDPGGYIVDTLKTFGRWVKPHWVCQLTAKYSKGAYLKLSQAST